MTEQPGRLTVGVIGAGPVGIAFAQALAGAGHILLGITAASPETKEAVEDRLPGLDILTPPEIIASADLVILAIPEDQLEKTIQGFTSAQLWRPGQLVVHTAAKYGIEVLEPAAKAGVIPLAIHPAMRFTGTSVDTNRLKDAYCAIDAPAMALPIASALAIELGAEPVIVQAHQRAAYTEAFEVATNFSAMVVNQAIGLLEQAGIENARGIISPSVRSSVERALDHGHTDVDPSVFLREEE